MFKEIILGYYRSPSLGEKLYTYEQELKKELRWRIFSCFSLVFVIFTIFLTSSISTLNRSNYSYSTLKNANQNSNLEYSVSSSAKSTVQPGEIISYTLEIKNISNKSQSVNFEAQTSDILEYATLIADNNFKQTANSIYWQPEEILPGEKKQKIFAIKVKEKIPSFRQSESNKLSYNCKIEVFFGNELSSPVKCPLSKTVENFSAILPKIDTKNVAVFFTILLFVSVILTFRTNLLYKEIKLVRKNYGRF